MNLYDLLEKYTWEGVKAYHFQFHRKRVASGKNIYLPSEWHQLDSELIASKCFAYPLVSNTWSQLPNRTTSLPRRISELPVRESTYHTNHQNTFERRINFPSNHPVSTTGITPTLTPPAYPQACRNWNYRECKNSACRYQHLCASCRNSHKLSQCNQGESALSVPMHSSLHRR